MSLSFNVLCAYVLCFEKVCLGIPPVVCAGDDPNLVKAIVLRVFLWAGPICLYVISCVYSF